jgi:hypothetical protein|tara:strand:+ start:640 stop:1233 length:594 start_codon:yes stop_codon:yes gene_type:complete
MESYIKVKNILSRDICKIVERYALYDIYNDKHEDSYVIGSHIKYADSLMESLLIFLKPEIEKQTTLKLVPTYSFFRIYKAGHVLPDHTDRPSCEISITIPIGFKYNGKSDDYLWPLHVYINEEKRYIPCDIGDGLIYKGCELKHGRETFDVDKGSYQIQMFLHYVDANGPYAEKYKYDGRDSIGIKKRKSNGIFLIS